MPRPKPTTVRLSEAMRELIESERQWIRETTGEENPSLPAVLMCALRRSASMRQKVEKP